MCTVSGDEQRNWTRTKWNNNGSTQPRHSPRRYHRQLQVYRAEDIALCHMLLFIHPIRCQERNYLRFSTATCLEIRESKGRGQFRPRERLQSFDEFLERKAPRSARYYRYVLYNNVSTRKIFGLATKTMNDKSQPIMCSVHFGFLRDIVVSICVHFEIPSVHFLIVSHRSLLGLNLKSVL